MFQSLIWIQGFCRGTIYMAKSWINQFQSLVGIQGFCRRNFLCYWYHSSFVSIPGRDSRVLSRERTPRSLSDIVVSIPGRDSRVLSLPPRQPETLLTVVSIPGRDSRVLSRLNHLHNWLTRFGFQSLVGIQGFCRIRLLR